MQPEEFTLVTSTLSVMLSWQCGQSTAGQMWMDKCIATFTSFSVRSYPPSLAWQITHIYLQMHIGAVTSSPFLISCRHNYYIKVPVSLLLLVLKAKLLQVTSECSKVKQITLKGGKTQRTIRSAFCHPVASSAIPTAHGAKFHDITTQ